RDRGTTSASHGAHPLAPPPFPYTTLFRSGTARRGRIRAVADRSRSRRGHRSRVARRAGGALLLAAGRARRAAAPTAARAIARRLDRKSTRLNFSHVSISYAVFCLKKKCVR